MTLLLRTCAVLLLSLSVVNTAEAHKINLFCWYEAETLYGEGYFSGGNPVQNSRVSLEMLESGTIAAETVTTENGTFSFPADPSVPVRVILDAGQGHRATWVNEGRQHTSPPLSSMLAALGGIFLVFALLYLWKRGHAA
ncbi:carboxypeptidase regulatory-like domain-containing protein [Prosthecochloris sp. N3]|uniref:Carboxypeptidase regulatory-like domain-containing protein n=1 Tax=Prosthecochloris ethylica TaxID=2743976 RepID=A0ABR9XSF8_9CHLB|nr:MULTISPECIES: carboxypeptidase regulatory-like domain-containing protein [Prosthecochloris]MEC9487051.1 carboxypeptidase regulatory-like domain-containing protein [Prosthecochloris sp.]MBF0585373.1 carboxypeptidase regulatory-like domain-containing protein [Prosthecochloris ethylica]MBF0636909.1 carboxypeptidase regulatory-like domain-containing protein [Prosthecochloris ethylica]NUK46602.1 carboxypeptidase regulatory-like domain-containing protein [Prosthecochloris ethylica]RNA64784.1 carb